MVIAFHDTDGLTYTNMVPRGTTVNAVYIIRALKVSLERTKQICGQEVDDDAGGVDRGVVPVEMNPASSASSSSKTLRGH